MSIFSRLRKRGPEDDGPAAGSPEKQAPPLPGLAPPPAPFPPAARRRDPKQAARPRRPRRRAATSRPGWRASSLRPRRLSRPRPSGAAAAAARGGAARKAGARARVAARAPPPRLTSRVPVAVKEPAAGSLDLAIALALDEPLAATARGRRRRPTRRPCTRRSRISPWARRPGAQRDAGGALGRSSGELARDRAAGAQVAAPDGVRGRTRPRWSGRWMGSSPPCRRRSSQDSLPP